MVQTTSVFTEGRHGVGFVVSEANGHRARNRVTITGQKLMAGAVLGMITLGAATAGATVGTGGGSVGTITRGATAKVGLYTIKFTKAAAGAGDFEVIDPTGEVCGLGTVGVAYAGGGLSFTVSASGADFTVGTTIPITVAAGSGKCVAWTPTATDGSQVVYGILGFAVDATAADKTATAFVRACEVNQSELIWDATSVGTATLAAKAGWTNAGTPTLSTVTLSSGVTEGVYNVVLTSTGTTAAYNVTNPTGGLVGTGNLGTQFSAGGLTFTITHSAGTDTVGDRYTITVIDGVANVALGLSGLLALGIVAR